MSKVICDVCGTTYPETAAACPICGCAKNSTEQTAVDMTPAEETVGYTYVKGGRFSKANVRKRNKKSARTVAMAQEEQPESANKGLIVVIILLFLAIVAVLCYIGFRVFLPDSSDTGNEGSYSQDQQQGSSDQIQQEPDEILCTDLELAAPTIELPVEGTLWQLSVQKVPVDTTETVTFTSSNEQVATVDAMGNITAVGGGEAVITVTCGEVTKECKVICSFGETETPSDDPVEDETAVPDGFVLKLKGTFEKNGFTMSERYPDPVSIYKEIDGVKATDITWTSDNEAVAKINENGVVSAVGKGNTVVRGTIGNQTVSCTVIVAFTPAQQTQAKYKISNKDVTLYLGGNASFQLSLKDGNGANVQNVVWTASEEGYVQINGRTVKALKVTSDLAKEYVTVSATVEGETYSCIVRVANAPTE